MSEKKLKLNVPKYDLKGQTMFLYDVCKNMDFDYQALVSLIFADWICTFQEGCQKASGRFDKVFITYLQSTESTYKKLKQIKKVVENEEKNNNSSC